MRQLKGFTPLETRITNREDRRFLTGFTVIEFLVVISVNISLMVALPILTNNIVEIMTVLSEVLVNREGPNYKERQQVF